MNGISLFGTMTLNGFLDSFKIKCNYVQTASFSPSCLQFYFLTQYVPLPQPHLLGNACQLINQSIDRSIDRSID